MSRKRGRRHREKMQEPRTLDPSRVWFVAHCLPMRDTRAAKELLQVGVDVWMPVYRATVVRRGRKVDVERRFFASYLFVGLEADARGDIPFRSVLDCDFVHDMLGQDAPAAFPVTLLQLLADRLAGQDKDETERGRRRDAAARFDLGSFHKIVGGPFSSFMAEITAILDTGMIRADVDIFGRKTPVEFEPNDLAAA